MGPAASETTQRLRVKVWELGVWGLKSGFQWLYQASGCGGFKTVHPIRVYRFLSFGEEPDPIGLGRNPGILCKIRGLNDHKQLFGRSCCNTSRCKEP